MFTGVLVRFVVFPPDSPLFFISSPLASRTPATARHIPQMGYLTVDYVRIPLVLGFFASRDRVSYLFNPELQRLLRAVLFEAGPWVSRHQRGLIEQTPVRLSAQVSFFFRSERCGSVSRPKWRQPTIRPGLLPWLRLWCACGSTKSARDQPFDATSRVSTICVSPCLCQ